MIQKDRAAGLLAVFLLTTRLLASPNAVELRTPAGGKTTVAGAFGKGHKVLVVTKPWCNANELLIGTLAHYRIRLNKGGLRSGVVFLRSDPAEAARAMETYKGNIGYYLDPEGVLAAELSIRELPAVFLLNPAGKIVYTAPVLSQAQIAQIAQHYSKVEKVFPAPKTPPSRSPGQPAATGGVPHYTIR